MESSTTRTVRDIELRGVLTSYQPAGAWASCGAVSNRDRSRFGTAPLCVGVVGDLLFNVHVLEFTGLEDFAALQAFHVFGVIIARNDLHARVLARFFH